MYASSNLTDKTGDSTVRPKVKWSTLLTLFMFNSLSAIAETVKTDWLTDQEGSVGKEIGAEVVTARTINDIRQMDVIFPDAEQYDPAKTRLQVFSKDEQGPKLLSLKQVEPLIDNNGKPYGIRIKLKKMKGFEFRLFLHQTDLQQ